MPILHVPLGIPGCGKTHMAEVLGAHVISTDAIRKILTGDENNQDMNGRVFYQFHEALYLSLAGGMSAYADATNLTGRSDLHKIVDEINIFTVFEVQTHLIIFRNLEQAIARNAARERVVPADVMAHMIEKYERALLDIKFENYDYVTEVSATS